MGFGKKIHTDRAPQPFEGVVELVSLHDHAIDYAAMGDVSARIRDYYRRPDRWRDILPIKNGATPAVWTLKILEKRDCDRLTATAEAQATSGDPRERARELAALKSVAAFDRAAQRVVGYYEDEPKGVTDLRLGMHDLEIPYAVREDLGALILGMSEGRITQEEGEVDEKKSSSPASSTDAGS